MALLRRLSSSISEVMAFDDVLDLDDEQHDNDNSNTNNNDSVAMSLQDQSCSGTAASSASAPGGASTSSPPRHPRPSSAAEESLSGLGRTTESLLRTMRLDVVLLGSREEEMRSALAKLDDQWGVLERVLEEHSREEERRGSAPAASNSNENEDGDSSKRLLGEEGENNSDQCASTIDWDGDDAESKKMAEKRGPSRAKNRASSTASQSMVIRRDEPEKISSQLSNSNFDWGTGDGDDDEMQEEARRASLLSSTGESLSKIINSVNQNVNDEQNGSSVKGKEKPPRAQNDVPIIRRMFSAREKPDGNNNDRGPRNRNTTADDNSSATASINKNNNNRENRWGIFGSGRNNRRTDGNSISTVEDNSVKTVETDRPPAFQLFGGKRRQFGEGQGSMTNEDGSVNNSVRGLFGNARQRNSETDKTAQAEHPFQRMFRRNNDNSNNNGKDLDASANTNETVETRSPSTSNSSDASSSNNNATANNNNNSEGCATDSEEAKNITSLQMKLRGRDSAASTLQQLLSYQTRNLFDLQYERNSLNSSSRFESKNAEAELEKLRSKLHFAKVERRRKSRLIEDAYNKTKKSQDQEERLKGELECIRTELLMLTMQMSKSERDGEGENTGGGGGVVGDRGTERRSRDRVVIVAGGGGGGGSESSSEWRAGAPAVPSSNRRQVRQNNY